MMNTIVWHLTPTLSRGRVPPFILFSLSRGRGRGVRAVRRELLNWHAGSHAPHADADVNADVNVGWVERSETQQIQTGRCSSH